MSRKLMLIVLRDTLNRHGLVAAHKQALSMTQESHSVSAEELITSVFDWITEELRDTGSLFNE